jgi:hypothetical protein
MGDTKGGMVGERAERCDGLQHRSTFAGQVFVGYVHYIWSAADERRTGGCRTVKHSSGCLAGPRPDAVLNPPFYFR